MIWNCGREGRGEGKVLKQCRSYQAVFLKLEYNGITFRCSYPSPMCVDDSAVVLLLSVGFEKITLHHCRLNILSFANHDLRQYMQGTWQKM